MKLITLSTLIASVGICSAATTVIDLQLSKSNSKSGSSSGSIAKTTDNTGSSSSTPATVTYTISDLTLDADGTANDSFTVTMQLSGTATNTVGGFGASFGYWGVAQSSGTDNLVDSDETLQFSITGLTLALSGGNAGSTINFDGFTGFNALNVDSGETYNVAGTTDNNASAVVVDSLPQSSALDTNSYTYTFSGGDGLEDTFIIEGDTGAMRYGGVLTQVTLEVVPEPSSAALLIATGMGALLRRRR